MLSKIIRFLKTDIWRIRIKTLSRSQSFFIKQLRIILLAVRGFDEDQCLLRASALMFFSLLSIVPVVAMLFGIAKGFGFERLLKEQLLNNFPGQEEVLTQVFTFAQSLLENTQGGVVAGIGVAILFWSVMKVLGNIERSFNGIWGIKEGRTIGRKLNDYLSMMLIGPVLFIMASSITVTIASQIEMVTQKISLLGIVSPLIMTLVRILPYCVIWVLFTFLYIFMPNTKVNFKSGVLAGIAAGTIYQIGQWAYIAFQVGVAKYNAIYGSFAALPLFLVWLQLSWLIVLFGAEISFAHQNVDTYEFEPDCLQVSNSFKKLLALRVVHLLVKNFCSGEQPWTDAQISHTLEVPIRLARQVLYELTQAGIITETRNDGAKSGGYQPAQSVGHFSIQYVIDALDNRGTDAIPVAESAELDALNESLRRFSDIVAKSEANIYLKDI